MRFVASLLLDNWQKQVDAITNGCNLFTERYDIESSFPLEDVRSITTRHIISKKERAVRGIADDRLMKIILRSHDVAIAFVACTHLLSQQAIRTLVVRDFVHLRTDVYLKLVLLAHLGSSNAVDELEYKRAKGVLLAFAHQPSALFDGQYMRRLTQLSIQTPVPKTSLVHAALQTALITFCPKLATALSECRREKEWNQCWKLIGWISILQEHEHQLPMDCFNPIEIFDQNDFSWRMWAAWRPKDNKLSNYRIDDEQRTELQDFLALEGPDESLPPAPTFCDHLATQEISIIDGPVAHVGNIQICLMEGTQEEASRRLRRIHECVSYMVSQNQAHVDLLILLVVQKEISVADQELLEGIVAVRDQNVVHYALKLKRLWSHPSLSRQHATDLLHFLGTGKLDGLKTSAIGRWAVERLTTAIQDEQNEYRKAVLGKDAATIICSENQLQSSMMHMQQLCGLFDWIPKLMVEPIYNLISNCPEKEHIATIQQMRKDLNTLYTKSARSVRANLEKYVQHLLLSHGAYDTEGIIILSSLIAFWGNEQPPMAQPLALILADGKGKFRAHCISHLHLLTDAHVSILLNIMQEWNWNSLFSRDSVCVKFADFLAVRASEAERPENVNIVAVWKPVLYRMLKARGAALIHYTQGTLTTQQYIKFMQDVQLVFGNKIVWNAKLSPAIMNPNLYLYIDELASYSSVLNNIENEEVPAATRYFLSGNDVWFLVGILSHLLSLEELGDGDSLVSNTSYAIARLLSLDTHNAMKIYDVLCAMSQMSVDGVSACSRLLNLYRHNQIDLAATVLFIWLRDSSWSDDDHLGLRAVAGLLGINVDETIASTTLATLADYIDERYLELLAEAKRLDYMRMDLKSRDQDGVTNLLGNIMVEDTSPMEDAFARLPVPLLNVVERIDDTQVELIFPLVDLTLLQRAALGVAHAQSLIIRLNIQEATQPKFCIHLDNETSLHSSRIHSQWTVFRSTRAPEQQICHGTITPVTYQLARVLTRYLVGGFKDLLSVHTLVSTSLKTMGSTCIVCGKHHGVNLRKATICDAWECTNIFARSPLEIRLSPIRQDPLAVDMLIRMIHSAIQSGYHNILPDCPLDNHACLEVMRTLPSMESLSKSKYFSVTVRNWHAGKTEQFLSWVCCSFRGFLATATGKLRIPSLPPGTLQFVLANGAPLKEMGFHTEFNANMQQSKVVFHGTSLDRLYPILHQGLKIMSGTPLQAYGAASGAGIYLADEPSTSWIYADRKAATRVNWSKSAIKNGRILLGCEMTGPGIAQGRGGVHVVTKESTVMVRYIFVVPTETTAMPIAGHLTSAMMSVFNSLRSGAL